MQDRSIYRRRRLGALLATTAAAYLLYANAGAAEPQQSRYHTVEPGDTLWRIATEHYPPGEDPREKVEELRRENGLGGYAIRSGTRLELPR